MLFDKNIQHPAAVRQRVPREHCGAGAVGVVRGLRRQFRAAVRDPHALSGGVFRVGVEPERDGAPEAVIAELESVRLCRENRVQ